MHVPWDLGWQVVARWFGGVLLGAVRWRHLVGVARQLLVQRCGGRCVRPFGGRFD
jgi:hypothetical protein